MRKILSWVATVTAIAVLAGSVPVVNAQTSDGKAKELYKAAQRSLNDEEYRDAAKAFKTIFEKHKNSKYVGDAMYWYAFALYRQGGRSNLRKASDALEVQMDRYGEAGDDASALYYRVLGQLARNGDEEAARKLEEAREDLGTLGDDMETKLMAMEALLNMDDDRALPILKSVMANKSPGTVELREKAVFLLSQHETDESVEILIETAKNDPSRKVREQAIFWLSQVDSDAAIAFLEEIVTTKTDISVRKKAVFAISQHDTRESAEILKRIALDRKNDTEIREQAIFWIGQSDSQPATEFLIQLYDQLDNDVLKEKVIFSVSQTDRSSGRKFLMSIVSNTAETVEMRKQALFWAGQSGALDVSELADLYSQDNDIEFRKQVVFVLSQSDDREAMDAMMQLARKEKNAELRKNLIFWIGQSDDPRAVEFLVDIINE